MLRRFFLAVSAASLIATPFAFAQTQDAKMTQPAKTGFAPINGLSLYYEIHGEGQPLLMLHGGIGASEQFGANVAELAKTRQVVIAHMQGHGFTRDIDRPYDMSQFAEDTAALLDYLKLGPVDVLGYSLGASVAQRLAVQHPQKVRRLVLVSGVMAADGSYAAVMAAFPAMVEHAAQIGAGMAASPLAKLYPHTNWENAFRKTGVVASQPWDWTAELIAAPALLIFADADRIRPEHLVAMYAKFDGFQRDGGLDGSGRSASRLMVIPNRTHYNLLEDATVAPAVESFLAADLPK